MLRAALRKPSEVLQLIMKKSEQVFALISLERSQPESPARLIPELEV